MKKVLLLQLREDSRPNQNEYEAVLRHGGLDSRQVQRVQMHVEDFDDLDMHDYAAVIVGGGPYDVSKPADGKTARQQYVEMTLKKHIDTIYEYDIPYMGICYGLGVLVDSLGGVVSSDYTEAVGPINLQLTDAGREDRLFSECHMAAALVGHHEGIHQLPHGAILLASSSTCPVQAIRVKQNIYGLQFHPELDTVGLAIRLEAYKHHGYFKPEEFDEIMDSASIVSLSQAHQVVRVFCQKLTN